MGAWFQTFVYYVFYFMGTFIIVFRAMLIALLSAIYTSKTVNCKVYLKGALYTCLLLTY